MFKKIIILIIMVIRVISGQDCTADDGTSGVELWGTCYSIQNTENLYLSNSGLSGEIPPAVGSLINLERLYINDNDLTGELPSEISNLNNLIFLNVSNNQLTGLIPDDVCNMNINWNGTSYFNLTNNQFCPPYPACITNQLVFPQDCADENCSDGSTGLWGWCYDQETTNSLSVWNSQLSGTIPTEIGELTNLETLNLGLNNFTGEIPASFGNLINLENLNLRQNQISGIIPTDLQNLTNLKYLDLSYNLISGNISDWVGSLNELEYLIVSSNNISGSLPNELGQISSLVNVELDYNQLNGEFPHWISNLTNLNVLKLNNNNFSGNIPDSYCDLPNVSQIDLRNNSLCPPYPDCLDNFEQWIVPQNCENMLCTENEVGLWGWCYNKEATTNIRLYNIGISGAIPAGIGELENLERLDLRYNQLSGEIPSEIGNLTNLLYLYLEHNQLVGEIPQEIGNLVNLQTLILNDNYLSGQLPDNMSNLVSLSGGGGWMSYSPGLSLANNNLSGQIPSWIGEFEHLTELNLSGNQFSGSIPEEIGNLSNLLSLQLNDNLLTGEIPDTIYQLNLTDRNIGHAPAVTRIPGFDISDNQLSGTISDSVCNFLINWNPVFYDDSSSSYFENNRFCPPYPSCIQNSIGTQDTLGCQFTMDIDSETFMPQLFSLSQNYPNPFNPTTSISYDLPTNEFVSINVFDLVGREVKTLVNKEQVAGFRSVKWDATNNIGQPVSAGMYIYTIQAGEFRQTRKMVLLK